MEEINDKSTSTFEVLQNADRKIYLDIEQIPYDKDLLIFEIISDFQTFLNVTDKSYALTINNNSNQHGGLSYHVVLPYVLDNVIMKQTILTFLTKFEKYNDFIDTTIYDIGRLFRLPNQYKPLGDGLCELDYHRIIEGSFNDFIIQNIKNIPTLTPPEGIEIVKVKSKKPKSAKYRKRRNERLELTLEQLFEKLSQVIIKVDELSNRLH